jgi:hypothetical protein
VEFLEGLRDKKEVPVKVSTRGKPLFSRDYGHAKYAYVIFLRFGSLTSNDHIEMSTREIQRITGVNENSQWTMFRRWRLDGFQMLRHRRGNTRGSKVTPE